MDEEGMFVVPVNYGFEWEDELPFISIRQRTSGKLIFRDPNVAFERER